MLIVGLDPGKKHFAYALLDVSKMKVLGTGLLENTIQSLTSANKNSTREKVNLFKREVKKLVKGYAGVTRNDMVIMERMQSRPGRGQAPVEMTNIMIGLTLSVVSEFADTIMVTASTWKRQVKTGPLKGMVGNCKFCRNTKCFVAVRNKRFCKDWKNDRVMRDSLKLLGIEVKTDHEADAVWMTYYAAKQFSGKPFLKLRNK